MTNAFNLSQLANKVNSSGLLNAATGLYNAVPVTNGGTGQTTLAAASIVTYTGTETLTNKTLTSPIINGAVMSSMASSVITSGTAVASTSGTSINFTGIPSWAKRITVMFQGVSLSATASALIQAGTGGTPTYTTSGYLGGHAYFSNGGTPFTAQNTSGFIVFSNNAAYTINGQFVLTNISGNNWVGSGVFMTTGAANFVTWNSGSIALGSALTAIRITSTSTDTFDAGSINILYE